MKSLCLSLALGWASAIAPAYAQALPFNAYIVQDEQGNVIEQKNADQAQPIASLTKLMTAYVLLSNNVDLSESLTISGEDVDTLKGTHSRLAIGATMSRRKALELALISSENRAAHALARTAFGNTAQFIAKMNESAKKLGMTHTRFVDPTGLSPENQASPKDLAKLVQAADKYSIVKQLANVTQFKVDVKGRETEYKNSNNLIRSGVLSNVEVSKTGYTSEAGRCIALKAPNAKGELTTLVGLGAGNVTQRTMGMREALGFAGASKKVSQKIQQPKASINKKKKTQARKKVQAAKTGPNLKPSVRHKKAGVSPAVKSKKLKSTSPSQRK